MSALVSFAVRSLYEVRAGPADGNDVATWTVKATGRPLLRRIASWGRGDLPLTDAQIGQPLLVLLGGQHLNPLGEQGPTITRRA